MDPISLWIILVDFSKGHRASIRFSDPSFREGIFEGWRSRGIKGDVDRGGGGSNNRWLRHEISFRRIVRLLERLLSWWKDFSSNHFSISFRYIFCLGHLLIEKREIVIIFGVFEGISHLFSEFLRVSGGRGMLIRGPDFEGNSTYRQDRGEGA